MPQTYVAGPLCSTASKVCLLRHIQQTPRISSIGGPGVQKHPVTGKQGTDVSPGIKFVLVCRSFARIYYLFIWTGLFHFILDELSLLSCIALACPVLRCSLLSSHEQHYRANFEFLAKYLIHSLDSGDFSVSAKKN